MSVLAPPPQDELELLIREARARRRKRWLRAAAGVALAAGIAVAIAALVSRPGSASTDGRGKAAGLASLRCRADQLRLSSRAYGASAGEFYTDFTFTNVSAQSCTLRGWPTLAVVLRSGRRVAYDAGRARNAGRREAKTVTLRPGGTASFNDRTADHYFVNPVPKCAPSRAILVTPPGGWVALRLATKGPFCGPGLDSVTPVVPGPLDRYVLG